MKKSSAIITIHQEQSQEQVLKRIKGKAYFRQGSFNSEIIWDDRRFIFLKYQKKISKDMFIFKSVLNDVKKYKEKTKIEIVEQYPVNFWHINAQNFDGIVTATDIDHAYWRVAYLLGVISEKTYTTGLKIEDKTLRLAALANLSSRKEYQIITNGVITEKTELLKFDPIHDIIYKNIRYTCYKYMNEIATFLKDDFICYKTDCIYYRDTKKNRLFVQNYLTDKGMDWKQLVRQKEADKKMPDGTNH